MGPLALQLVLSLAAVLALVAFAHFLGFSRGGAIADKGEARELLELAAGGFDAVDIAVGAGGRGAIARDASGRLAVLFPHGGQFVARVLGHDAQRLADDDTLTIRHPDLPRGALTLQLEEAAEGWARCAPSAN